MFIKYENRILSSGEKRTYVSIVEGYRDINGNVKQRRIKSYGYIEAHKDKEAFLGKIERELKQFEAEQDNNFQISLTEEENKNNSGINKSYNYGYRYIESIYEALNIKSFISDFEKSLKIKAEYKFDEVFKFLVIQRVLNPGSKRDNIKELKRFYNLDLNFSLDDVYRFLTYFSKAFDSLQVYLKQNVDKIFKNSSDRIYYDVTNYHFHIDFNDSIENYRHKGVSKQHQLTPIIGLSLFIDNKGIPIKFNIFNGNTAESTTLIKELKKVKKEYNIDRTVVIADKGMNTSKNIIEILENGDGYLFSQILRSKKGKRYHEHVLNDEGYIKTYDEAGNVTYKYKVFIEEYELKIHGKPKKLKRKVLIYYNLKDDIKMKNKRFEKILKAEKALTNNAYSIEHSYMQYIKKEIMNKKTGEINSDFKEFKNLDTKKIAKDELFDGYFCLITSELQYDHLQMREDYHKLSGLEDTFKVTKTNLEFRPVYHFKKENIESHFLICYTALLIIRLLQYKLKNDSINLSVERIIEVLNKMNVKVFKDHVNVDYVGGKLAFREYEKDNKVTFNNHFAGTDQLEKDYALIKLAFNTPYDKALDRVENFNRYFKSIKFHTTSA